MIIYLKGANFSSNKIGTLDTWTINASNIGRGATYNGPSSVKRNAAFSATITLAADFEFSGKPIVTMNGAEFECVSLNEANTIATITISSVTGNVVIKAPTVNTATGEEDSGIPGSGGESVVPENMELLSESVSAFASSNRLAKDAYIANMAQIFLKGTIIGKIELPLTNSKELCQETTTINNVNVWVFNSETNMPVSRLITNQSFTSVHSDKYNCEAIYIDINKTFDFDCYFGYSNDPTGNTAISYVGGLGNYLSGDIFELGSAIATNSSYAILAAVYGEAAPDEVVNLIEVAKYNTGATSVMAGNCYVACKDQTIPANTNIQVLDIKTTQGNIEGLNVYVVNANTNVIVEMLADELTVPSMYSDTSGWTVARLRVNKTYNHPIYFMFNSERVGSPNRGLYMSSGIPNSLLLVDDERKPAVGDNLTSEEWKAGYNIGHIVYA